MAAAGTGRFYAITVFYGNNAVHYTSEKLLEGVERVWLRYYTEVNPAIMFPIIPYRSLCWFLAHSLRAHRIQHARPRHDRSLLVILPPMVRPSEPRRTRVPLRDQDTHRIRSRRIPLSGLAHTYSVLWDEQYSRAGRTCLLAPNRALPGPRLL